MSEQNTVKNYTQSFHFNQLLSFNNVNTINLSLTITAKYTYGVFFCILIGRKTEKNKLKTTGKIQDSDIYA